MVTVSKVLGKFIWHILKKSYQYLIEDLASKILDKFWNLVDPIKPETT